MPSQVATLPRTLLQAPLPDIVQRLGLAIAQAQLALDQSSIALAKELIDTTLELTPGDPRSLLSLGFTPTFYAFTEATVEARLTFTMSEVTETSVAASLGVNLECFAATVDASYSRKFSFEASGSSSVIARLATVPAPTAFLDLLAEVAEENSNDD